MWKSIGKSVWKPVRRSVKRIVRKSFQNSVRKSERKSVLCKYNRQYNTARGFSYPVVGKLVTFPSLIFFGNILNPQKICRQNFFGWQIFQADLFLLQIFLFRFFQAEVFKQIFSNRFYSKVFSAIVLFLQSLQADFLGRIFY